MHTDFQYVMALPFFVLYVNILRVISFSVNVSKLRAGQFGTVFHFPQFRSIQVPKASDEPNELCETSLVFTVKCRGV